ncbi:Cytochrome P450 78A6 [Linum grandiflorum]
MKTEIESLWLFALASKGSNIIAWPIILAAISLIFLTISLLHWSHSGGPAWGKYYVRRPSTSSKSFIPGPSGLPIIGSMTLMASLAHRKIAAVAQAYKARRLLAFSLGETRVIVTCHPDVAREILNGSVFVDRPVKESAYRLMFGRAIGFAPYGVYWRTLRRIAAAHLFSPKQIKASESQRRAISEQMVEAFVMAAVNGPVTVRGVLKRASLNHMMGSVFGRQYELYGSNSEVNELKELVEQGYELLGLLNWSDHLPWLADFDSQKIRSRCSGLVPRVNRLVAGIIAEHRSTHSSEETRDFVDVLLSLQGADKLSDSDMIAVLWEMIFRGTDTVAVLIEWILARMALHPESQSNVHDELDRHVGRSRAVQESDIQSLPYLQGVVKEVLRLHPPGPLLSWARLATVDTTIDGYQVPAGTTAMVNMWAISRDPEFWSNPLEFVPERFVGGGDAIEMSVMGSDLRLAPFGSGRRACPGKNLGMATASFWIATILHEFEVTSATDGGGVDLSEVLKLSCEMATPLTVKLRPRRLVN